MPDLEDDLRATADDIAADAARLTEIEEEKTRLDADDPTTRKRAVSLQLINLELSLVESWLAEGEPIGTTPQRDGQITAAALQGRRGQVLVPLREGTGNQFVASPPRGNLSLLVAGVAAVAPLAAACLVIGALGLLGTGWVGYWTRRLDRGRRRGPSAGVSPP